MSTNTCQHTTIHCIDKSFVFQKCEQFAASLLDHCDAPSDRRTILEYSPQDVLDVNNDNSNWHLALLAHQKSFVGHHYYQHFFREKVRTDRFNMGSNVSMFPFISRF